MSSFRYHIVSIVSVFLALAVGIALGGGPLKGEVDNTLVSQVQTDRQTKLALQSQITALRSSNTFTDDFAKTVAPGLIGGTRFRLDPSVNVDKLQLHPVAKMVARAAQTYGFIVTDQSGAVAVVTAPPRRVSITPIRRRKSSSSH